MAYRTWEAILTRKGPIVDIDFCGDDDDDGYHGQECMRRRNSEPNLQKLVHPQIYPSQVRITVDPYSKPLEEVYFDDASTKGKTDSDYDASTVAFCPWTSEESDFSQASGNLGANMDKDYESYQFEDWDDLDADDFGAGVAQYSSDGHLTSENTIAKTKRQKKQRPCKGQRIRHQKLEARLMSEIEQQPEVFDFDGMSLPPSFAKDASRKRRLVTKLQAYKHNVMREREIESILRPLCDPYQIGGANIPYARDYSMVPCVTMSNPLATVPAYQA
jgi:hypothetical protein